MATYFELDNEAKRMPVTVALTNITTQLFTILLENKIDPDTFDIENSLSDAQIAQFTDPTGPGEYMVTRVQNLCEAYLLTKQKLDSLSE